LTLASRVRWSVSSAEKSGVSIFSGGVSSVKRLTPTTTASPSSCRIWSS
jgi:hypothetical protein